MSIWVYYQGRYEIAKRALINSNPNAEGVLSYMKRYAGKKGSLQQEMFECGQELGLDVTEVASICGTLSAAKRQEYAAVNALNEAWDAAWGVVLDDKDKERTKREAKLKKFYQLCHKHYWSVGLMPRAKNNETVVSVARDWNVDGDASDV